MMVAAGYLDPMSKSLSTGLRVLLARLRRKPLYRTKSGRVLTDADIEALADEAERGYDVEHLLQRTR